MKTLILIRHAKSSWDDLGARDFDRSLNHRGRHDAPLMGERLAARLNAGNLALDVLLCSSAQRARETAELLIPALGFAVENVEWRRELYLASPRIMLKAIQAMPDEAATVALLAHNPGITELAEILTGKSFGNVPTCGVITLALPVDHWRGVTEDVGAELIDFDYPRRLSGSSGQE